MEMKRTILLGIITAIALCAIATAPTHTTDQTIINIPAWTCILIPIVLLPMAIYKFKITGTKHY
jgi:hypothetical protein